MAVNFTDDRDTKSGPLDVSKNAGSDDVSLLDTAPVVDGNGTAPLDPAAVGIDPHQNDDEAETLREKNPLGYTITPPTAAEIDAGG